MYNFRSAVEHLPVDKVEDFIVKANNIYAFIFVNNYDYLLHIKTGIRTHAVNYLIYRRRTLSGGRSMQQADNSVIHGIAVVESETCDTSHQCYNLQQLASFCRKSIPISLNIQHVWSIQTVPDFFESDID